MKLKICLLLVCGALSVVATEEGFDTVDGALQTSSAEGIMEGFGLEILLTKLEHMDHKLTELQVQMNHLEGKIASNQCFYEKPSAIKTKPKHQQPPLTSCKDAPVNASGVYLIRVNNASAPFKVYCEMEKFGGGWIVLQHRFDGSVDFFRNWNQYRDGFGEPGKEFWLGLERIHQLTIARNFELMVEVKDFNCTYGFARYNAIQVGSESEHYVLKTVGSYSGTAGDGMKQHEGIKFSTKDRDNDAYSEVSWAAYFKSGWWHYKASSNLNGPRTNKDGWISIWWYYLKSDFRGLSFSRMMIREL